MLPPGGGLLASPAVYCRVSYGISGYSSRNMRSWRQLQSITHQDSQGQHTTAAATTELPMPNMAGSSCTCTCTCVPACTCQACVKSSSMHAVQGRCSPPNQGGHLMWYRPDPQVILIELIGNVPTNRPELAALLHNAVEECQCKQQPPERRISDTAFQELP